MAIQLDVNVAGVPVLLAQVRGEIARAVREIATTEQDARVVARLYELAARIAQDVAEVEARAVVTQAPETRHRFGEAMTVPAVDGPVPQLK